MNDKHGFHVVDDAPEVESKNNWPVKLTEDAQAKAFVDIQNDNARYVEEIGQWFIHNGVY
jgi:hypothetical protein